MGQGASQYKREVGGSTTICTTNGDPDNWYASHGLTRDWSSTKNSHTMPSNGAEEMGCQWECLLGAAWRPGDGFGQSYAKGATSTFALLGTLTIFSNPRLAMQDFGVIFLQGVAALQATARGMNASASGTVMHIA